MSENEKEVWKTVEGAERYEISSLGRFRNKHTSKLLKGTFKVSGNNLIVIKYRNNENKIMIRNLGMMVAKHFIDNPNNYKWINYKDSDYYNTVADNIEWSEHRVNHGEIITRSIDKTGRNCSKCGEFKSWDKFSLCCTGINNHSAICKKCKHNYYNENSEKILIKNKEYYYRNQEKILEQSREYRNKHVEILNEKQRKYAKSKVKYTKTKAKKLTIVENPLEDKDGYMIVKCKHCRKYFHLTNEDFTKRSRALVNFGLGEAHVYCSDACRAECPLYNKRFYPDGVPYRSKYSSARSSEWTKIVLERDNYTCQACGSQDDVIAHHIIPVAEDYIQSADYDNGITLCKKCHQKKHKEIAGCGYQELRSLCR